MSGKNCFLLLFEIGVGCICDILWELYVQIKYLRVNLIQTNENSCMTIILPMKNTTEVLYF